MPTLHNPEHIRYYRALEDDLEATFRYVEPQSQLDVHSDEFARIILVAATEVENVLREFAVWAQGYGQPKLSPPLTILKLTDVVAKFFPKFATMQILAPSISVLLYPWKDLSATSAPDWWTKGYNKIKHDRQGNMNAPTLRRALQAVGALQVVLLHYYRLRYGPTAMLADRAIPRLLVPWDSASPHGNASELWQFELPDDPKESAGSSP